MANPSVMQSTPLAKSVPKCMTCKDVDLLLLWLGCEKKETRGSGVFYILNEVLHLNLHRPYPDNELSPFQMQALRDFLEYEGIEENTQGEEPSE